MLVFFTPLNIAPLTFSMVHLPPPSPLPCGNKYGSTKDEYADSKNYRSTPWKEKQDRDLKVLSSEMDPAESRLIR